MPSEWENRKAERAAMSEASLKMPAGLSAKGKAAHAAIMEVLRANELADTGGCPAFYSPAEWRERGEKYGRESELVVVYDGGDLLHFFNSDSAYESKWVFSEKMRERLAKEGLYYEECTGWYAAIYPAG